MAAWGSTAITGDSAFGQTRTLGPIEYVCVWYAQPSNLTPLSRQQVVSILVSLLTLVAAHPPARELYSQKLLADVEDPLSGSLSSQSRAAMQVLAERWQSDAPATDAVDDYLATLQAESPLFQIAPRPFDSPG